ncbi:flagellar protein FlhE [Salinisphaera sp. T31B1]|uniref:flagellar protein FlhE n=1 Tax=Salinisphaera sp. T31B1 TaxID=727963 RepID=UPI0033428DC7
MRRRAFVALLWLALVLAAASPAGHAWAAGSWVAEATAPTLRQRGWRYTTAILRPRSSTPVAGRAIRSVSWRYGFGSPGPAPDVWLCGAGRCIDASTAVGRSTGFAGLAPTTGFRFVFRLAGQGMLADPRRGGALQLVVNFE